MMDIITVKYREKEILKKRRLVGDLFTQRSANVKSPDIKVISDNDLALLFELYDHVFFQGWFADNFPGTLGFKLSRRMTKSAGITSCPRNIDLSRPESMKLEVRISLDFIFHYDIVKGSHMVSGLPTKNSLQALQLVFEHELVHVMEFVHFRRSNCHQERFQTIARNLFGHTDSYHQLPTTQQIARQKLGIVPGDKISFPYEGKRLEGFIHRINKRATVMVSDQRGDFSDHKGNRYTKYYVPLSIIRKI